MNERIRMLRKSLDYTQQKFADKLGVKRNTVGQWEIGRNVPTDAIILSICREFGVNEEWLRNGTGEMFEAVPEEDEYLKAAMQLSKNNDEIAMQAVIEYWKLDDASKEAIRKYVRNLAQNVAKKTC